MSQSYELKAEALKQLAWAKDPEGVPLAAKALTSPAEPVQGMAAQARCASTAASTAIFTSFSEARW